MLKSLEYPGFLGCKNTVLSQIRTFDYHTTEPRMSSKKHVVFVTGATGAQGGAVARSLLSAGHAVHALARDPSSTAAQTLSELGATVFPGDFDDPSSLTSAAKGCTAAFINLSPVFTDPSGEARHGRNVVAACREAGIARVIESSVPSVDRLERGDLNGVDNNPTLKYRYAKIHVERAVKEAGFDNWTILRVPRLLHSFVDPKLSRMVFPKLAGDGVIRTVLPPDEPQSVLDTRDIGRAFVHLLDDTTGRYRNKKLALSGETLTFQDIANAMNEALGQDRVHVEYVRESLARELGKTDPIVASELLYLDNPGFLLFDENDFDFKLSSAKEYFTREKAALERAVGLTA